MNFERQYPAQSLYEADPHLSCLCCRAPLSEPISSVSVRMGQVEIRKDNSMAVRTLTKLLPILALLIGGAAFAQGAGGGAGGASGGGAAGTSAGQGAGTTSGTASGTNVEPSAKTQKQNSGRSSAGGAQLQGSSDTAGAPAIEGRPGTESAPLPDGQTNPSPK
jgi:hypothetical protein